jgi:hypothetical protein
MFFDQICKRPKQNKLVKSISHPLSLLKIGANQCRVKQWYEPMILNSQLGFVVLNLFRTVLEILTVYDLGPIIEPFTLR